MFKNKTLVFIAFCMAIYYAMDSKAQVVGGSGKGQQVPHEVKPAELSAGEFSGDVNVFSGIYSSSFPLGTVSTPTGLGYTVSLNYGGTFGGGNTPSFMSGIPYGEGWQVSTPSISVSTSQYNKYLQETMRNYSAATMEDCNKVPPDSDCIEYTSIEDVRRENSLHWFAPNLSIPGVASGRMIYKSQEPGHRAVFVLHTFDTYIEAYSDGARWEVVLPDGIKYYFNMAQITERNPSQSRLPNPLQENNEVVAATLFPRGEVAAWYLTNIVNPNFSEDEIELVYKGFGKIDFYKEYAQYLFKGNEGILAEMFGTEHSGRFVPYKDLLLVGVKSTSQDIDIERLDLEYETEELDNAGDDILSIDEPGVKSFDALYNYKTVWHQGAGEGTLNGLSYPINSAEANFTGWKRFLHAKATNGDADMGSGTNPYIQTISATPDCDMSGSNLSGYRTESASTSPSPNRIGFWSRFFGKRRHYSQYLYTRGIV